MWDRDAHILPRLGLNRLFSLPVLNAVQIETTFSRIRAPVIKKMKTDPRVQPSAKQWSSLCKPGVVLISLGVGEECQAVKKQQWMSEGEVWIYKVWHFSEFSSSFNKNQNEAPDLLQVFTVICLSTGMKMQECTSNASTCFKATKLER